MKYERRFHANGLGVVDLHQLKGNNASVADWLTMEIACAQQSIAKRHTQTTQARANM